MKGCIINGYKFPNFSESLVNSVVEDYKNGEKVVDLEKTYQISHSSIYKMLDACEVERHCPEMRLHTSKPKENKKPIVAHCDNCGKDIFGLEGIKYCPYCGKELITPYGALLKVIDMLENDIINRYNSIPQPARDCYIAKVNDAIEYLNRVEGFFISEELDEKQFS